MLPVYLMFAIKEMEGNVFFNDTLNSFYLQLDDTGHKVKDHSDREETCCHHYIGYTFQSEARVLLYAPSHRQDSTGKKFLLNDTRTHFFNGYMVLDIW